MVGLEQTVQRACLAGVEQVEQVALVALVEPQGARVQVATRQVEPAALAPLGLIPSVWA